MQLTNRRLILLWLPLAATWLLMSVENPLVQAAISRMPLLKENLAAFGVAWPILVLLEAPVFLIISAANTLARNRTSYIRLRNFTCLFSAVLCGAIFAAASRPVFAFIGGTILHLDPQITELGRHALLVLCPTPLLVAYRRLYQGILIQAKLNHLVGTATVFRLCTLVSVLAAAALWSELPGAIAGAGALLLSFAAEAAIARFMARNAVKSILGRPPAPSDIVTYTGIIRFYIPLGLTSVIFHIAPPVLAVYMSRAPYPVESIAVLPLIHNFSWVFGCLVFAMQELIISTIGGGAHCMQPLRAFFVRIVLVVSFLYAAVILTPLADVVFAGFYGLPETYVELAVIPARFSAVVPLLLALSTWQRSVLIYAKRTRWITVATLAEVGSIIVLMGALVNFTSLSGVTAAVIAMLCGRMIGIAALYRSYSKALEAGLWPSAVRERPEAAVEEIAHESVCALED